MDAVATHETNQPEKALPRGIGLHGRTTVLGAMAGGVALGGVLVAAMTLSGRLSGHGIFETATALFIVGAFLGLIHGGALGFLGRPAGVHLREAFGDLGRAVLYAIPGVALAWLASIWVAMTLIAAYTGRSGALLGAAAGWTGAGIILSAAAIHGWRALRNAYARWPERRPGTLLTAASFAALLLTFLADRPELWGLRLRFTEVGAVLLAAFLAVWVAGPLITVGLRLARRLPLPRPLAGLEKGRTTLGDVVIGLLVGTALGLLAVPFAVPTTAPAVAGTVVLEVSQALVNEVVLRLFLVTAVAWLMLRRHRLDANEALVGAVVAATLVQVLLYTPGALEVGFAAWTGTAAFLITVVAIPGAALGVLFWRRGFVSALVADAVALAAVAVLG